MADSSKIATLMTDHERYDTTFAEYCKRSRKYEVLEDWINSFFPEKIINAMDVKETEELRTLGVGSGSGQVEGNALKQLLTKWSKIKHTVIEPNSEFISRFKDLAAKENGGIASVAFDWRQQTLEQFRRQTSADQSTKYHFIMVVQVLYYFEDVEEVLKYLTSSLTDGGIMVVIMVGDNTCMPRIAEHFPQLQNKFWHGGISTRHIEQMLTASKNKFETHQIQTNIDSTGCFDDDSEEGQLLIDFVTQAAYLKKRASESLYNEIINYMKSDEVSLPKSADGKSWFRCNYDAIVVTK